VPIRKQHVFSGGSSISVPSPGQDVRRHRCQTQGGWQNLQMRQLGQGRAHDWALQKLTTSGEAMSGDPSGNTQGYIVLGHPAGDRVFQDQRSGHTKTGVGLNLQKSSNT